MRGIFAGFIGLQIGLATILTIGIKKGVIKKGFETHVCFVCVGVLVFCSIMLLSM